MEVTGKKEPYLDFIRELVIEMMTRHGCPSALNRIGNPTNQYDGVSHLIVANESGRKNCRQCAIEGTKNAKSFYHCEQGQMPIRGR